MNYLAHLLLSESVPGIRVGNFIGDQVRGRKWQDLPVVIGNGVLLHRFIDEHADTHPVNAALRRLMRDAFGRYAGVALDLIHDHFLARAWDEHCPLAIPEFLSSMDRAMDIWEAQVPAEAFGRWKRLYNNGWLSHYGEHEGMVRVFEGMRQRIAHPTGFERADHVLRTFQTELQQGFNDYFPQLQLASHERLCSIARIRPGNPVT